jgi:hypothetical protein
MWYALVTVLLVFGGVASLVLLALFSNRGVKTLSSPQSPVVQSQPQGDSNWGKWGKRIGWGFFGLVLFDIYRKIFGSLPVEWKDWVPSFSWTTIEIIIVLIGVGFLLWEYEKPKTDEEVKKVAGTPKAAPRNVSSLVKFIITIGLGTLLFFLYEYNIAHVGELATSVKNGCLYIPTIGLLFAGAIMVLAIVLASFNIWWVEIPAWVLFFSALVGGMWNHWFMPHIGDLVVQGWFVLFGAIGGLLVALLGINDDDTRTASVIIFIFTMAAVWFPQFALWA